MGHILIDTRSKEGRFYNCKSDLAEDLGLKVRTIFRWKEDGRIKYWKEYIICFDCEQIKCRNKVGRDLR